jgi:hypothetical protein
VVTGDVKPAQASTDHRQRESIKAHHAIMVRNAMKNKQMDKKAQRAKWYASTWKRKFR